MVVPNPFEYLQVAKSLPKGKKLPGAIYTAFESIESWGDPFLSVHKAMQTAAGFAHEHFEVIKWHTDLPKISFLKYPGFLTEAHPALHRSVLYDLSTGETKVMDYSESDNPPILHRTEEFLSDGHPLESTLRQLTRLEERHGLYANPSKIGFHKYWQELLDAKRITYSGLKLSYPEHAGRPILREVLEWRFERQRTAMKRPSISLPVRLLLERGLLTPQRSFFDYGCGYGVDFQSLSQSGFTASGWDPSHFPGYPKTPADIVHCGYVLNVIEDPTERIALLRDAFSLCRHALSVAVRIETDNDAHTGRPFDDGEVTTLKTFQKYYAPQEFISLLEQTLEAPVLALAPGVALIAKDHSFIYEAIAAHTRRVQHGVTTPNGLFEIKEAQPSEKRKRFTKSLQIQTIIQSVRPELENLGRTPRTGDWTPPEFVTQMGLSALQLWNHFVKTEPSQHLEELAVRRRNETLVFLGMAQFRGVPNRNELPIRLRNDIDDFLGGYRQGLALTQTLLLQLGKPQLIAQLCDATLFGVCDEQALYIHRDLLSKLDPVLQLYVGCADILGACVSECDLIKIHKRSRKVTLLKYQDFDLAPLPGLLERVKVSLKDRCIQVFDHRSQPRQLLFDKDLYIDPDDQRLDEWQKASEALGDLIGMVKGRGPDHLQLRKMVEMAKGDPNIWVPELYPATPLDDVD